MIDLTVLGAYNGTLGAYVLTLHKIHRRVPQLERTRVLLTRGFEWLWGPCYQAAVVYLGSLGLGRFTIFSKGSISIQASIKRTPTFRADRQP